ncbi:MAG: GTPase HflX, partial [Halorientalis sp.]
MTETHPQTERAVIAKRVDSGTADTEEVRDLARAAGYEVVGEVTQTRTEDPAHHIGEGKAETLAATVAATDATVVVFDNQLGPYQTYNLGNKLPEDTRIMDRFRLILEIFGQRAQTRKAQLQVEL